MNKDYLEKRNQQLTEEVEKLKAEVSRLAMENNLLKQQTQYVSAPEFSRHTAEVDNIVTKYATK